MFKLEFVDIYGVFVEIVWILFLGNLVVFNCLISFWMLFLLFVNLVFKIL